MGESKQPLFAYVDESGNTGKNIFDIAQPDFFTAALVSKGDFDLIWGPRVVAVAKKTGGSAIHANELGLGRLEAVADDLLDILIDAQANFFVSRVEKRYLLATKMFDVLFDSGENAAVAWHNYNFRPLKIMLAFKLAHAIDEEVAREFWDFILITRREEATKRLPAICEKLKLLLPAIPDARSREVLGDGLDWVIKHPECIHVVQIEQKAAKQGHFPNLVAFMNLLRGLDEHAKSRRKQIARIVHDEQSEFGKMLEYWHGLHANAAPEPITWVDETWSVQLNPGSDFLIQRDEDSPGIQMADTALWLYGQSLKGKDLPPACARFLWFVLQRGYHSDFSFQGVSDSMMERWGEVFFGPMEEEKLEAARKLLAEGEEARQASMARYDTDGVPPFARDLPTKLKGDP
ncbi:DUF3800 domain-containing protein [Brevundimonas diminuta]|uniref:DUF3800 domain-containing protein n=1 Tax=Brevundimonas diminuta TaxID=293 RepID=UPI002097C40B|nr:DUF3800 domain-containing protein [Brevundimonas diminuta]MCO8018228.1 DUF3800 domain-containing protein [Brevundimonas diminuta]MCO8022248.1 DUF3800 domain-containing protein [Brevundimonas diminuta]